MVDVVGWMNDWLTELAGSLTGLEQVCAGSSDHLAGEPRLTNLAHVMLLLLLLGSQIDGVSSATLDPLLSIWR